MNNIKKKRKKRGRRSFFAMVLISCMFTTLYSVSIPVFAETSGEYTYAINSDQLTCTITKYNGVGGNIVIPSSFDAYTVTAIGNNAFKNITSVTGVTIPNTVTTIGDYGFEGMTNLTSISIPNSVTTIGNYAFMLEENLTSMVLPNSVTSIGTQAFSNCYKLETISLPNSITTIGFGAFTNCRKIKSITIPNQLSYISNSMFIDCFQLENVIMPNSITTIRDWAFHRCPALKTLTIPKSVTTIGRAAFYDCKTLTSLYIDGNPSIASDVFGTNLINPLPTIYSPSADMLSGFTCKKITPCSITVNSVSNGSIIPSALSGMKDEIIGVKMNPADGYTSNPSLLKYSNGTSDAAIMGTFFIMPDTDISITGGFEQIPIPTVTSASFTTNDQTPTWNWTDATGQGYYRYKLNGESWNYTTLTSFTQATNLTDGNYTLYVQEINDNADWSSSGSAAVTVIRPKYNVGIGSLSGGAITANQAIAKEGETVNLTINPSTGKQLKAGTLKHNDGSDHIITGTSFVMPAANVMVTAQFEDTPVIINPKSSSSSSHNSTKNTTIPSIPVSNKPTVPIFNDTTNHWAKADIEFVVSQGLMTGTSNENFSPKAPMTRGMFVTALGRLAKIDISGYNRASFHDVKTGSFYGPYVEWADKNNIVSGTGSNQFMPDKAITREEMTAIMINYAKNLDYTVPVNNAAVIYEDDENISPWSKDAVVSMQQAGVFKGKYNNYFAPKDTANRAEASAVLHRFVKLIIE